MTKNIKRIVGFICAAVMIASALTAVAFAASPAPSTADFRNHVSTPTPAKDSENYITKFITDKTLKAYVNFDGNVSDATGNYTVSAKNTVTYEEGFFGQAANVTDGYVSIENYVAGSESFTAGIWVKTDGVESDPVLFGNGNWDSSKKQGFLVSINDSNTVILNVANGSARYKETYKMPDNYKGGWTYILVGVDVENQKLLVSIDFSAYTITDFETEITSLKAALDVLNIGQHGPGDYKRNMTATVDEFVLFDGILTPENVNALSSYYGRIVESFEMRNHTSVATPAKDGGKYITNYIDKELAAYLNFDGDTNDAVGKVTASAKGTVEYKDGFFGQGIDLHSGYVSIANHTPDKNSFTVGMWVKADNYDSDPILFGNKDWSKGTNVGYAFTLRNARELMLNYGDGTNKFYAGVPTPTDFYDGWMYVVVSVGRTANKIKISTDFSDFAEMEIPEEYKDLSFNAYSVLNIGQDGTGAYSKNLPAVIDEFVMFNDVLDNDDIAALANYYAGKEIAPENPENPETSDGLGYAVFGFVVSFMAISATVTVIKRKKKNYN